MASRGLRLRVRRGTGGGGCARYGVRRGCRTLSRFARRKTLTTATTSAHTHGYGVRRGLHAMHPNCRTLCPPLRGTEKERPPPLTAGPPPSAPCRSLQGVPSYTTHPVRWPPASSPSWERPGKDGPARRRAALARVPPDRDETTEMPRGSSIGRARDCSYH